MTVELDQMIVPVRDKEASARFFARIFGLAYDGPMPPFAPVRVNDRLTLEFDDHDDHGILHYAFKVSDEEFDAILGRIQAERIPYGSGPYTLSAMQLNQRKDGPSPSLPAPNR